MVIQAAPSVIMDVIADFPAYPTWAKGVQEARVEGSNDSGRANLVHFMLDVAPIKDEYTLSYSWDQDNLVSWTLVQGNILKSLEGSYSLREVDDVSTEVTYRLALDVSIPLIGMLKRKGEKLLIETALKGLKNRVESL